VTATSDQPGVAVLRRDELPPGGRACVEAFGTTIALFNVGGRLYAVDNTCPHHGGPLCHGRIGGALLPARQYEHVLGLEGKVLTCPWHGWEFNLETGATLFEPHVMLARYQVWVEDEHILLSPA
jgi:nitrite reductase/ring-hydroxylating ferredoxin subunit